MRTLFPPLACLVMLLLPMQAWAAAWATIERIEVLDDSGQWHSETTTAAASRTRGGETVPIRLGLDVAVDDTLTTQSARLRVRYRDGGQLNVQPESQLQLTDWGVFQALGQVLYQVEGVFRVRFGAVEAAVEGTRFLVAGEPDGPVTVAVDRGHVWVRASGQQVLVHKGQVVTVPAGGVLGEVQWHSDAQAASLSAMTTLLGEPRVALGVIGGSALTAGAVQGTAAFVFRVRVKPGWRITGSAGGATTGQRFHLPVSLGVERRLGPVGLGIEGVAFFGETTDCFGLVTLPLLPGVAATGRLRLPLTDRVALEARLRGGYAGGLMLDAGLGVSVGLGL